MAIDWSKPDVIKFLDDFVNAKIDQAAYKAEVGIFQLTEQFASWEKNSIGFTTWYGNVTSTMKLYCSQLANRYQGKMVIANIDTAKAYDAYKNGESQVPDLTKAAYVTYTVMLINGERILADKVTFDKMLNACGGGFIYRV